MIGAEFCAFVTLMNQEALFAHKKPIQEKGFQEFHLFLTRNQSERYEMTKDIFSYFI